MEGEGKSGEDGRGKLKGKAKEVKGEEMGERSPCSDFTICPLHTLQRLFIKH